MTLAPVEDVIAASCECGCGTEINSVARRIVALRRSGLSLKAAAEAAGVSYSTARMASRQAARFARGHSARRGPWESRECRFCGATFKTPPTSDRSRCRNCPALNTADTIRLNIFEFDAREAAKNAELRERRRALVGGTAPNPRGTPRAVAEKRAQFDEALAVDAPHLRHLSTFDRRTASREYLRYVENFDPSGKSHNLKFVPPLPDEDRLVADNLGLVGWTINKYYWRAAAAYPDQYDDLVAAGTAGLLRAVRGYDPTKAKLSTYAVQWIRNAVGREIARRIEEAAASLDAPVGEEGGTTLGELIADHAPSVEADALPSELDEAVRIVVQIGDERHGQLLRLIAEGSPVAEAGRAVGVSQQLASLWMSKWSESEHLRKVLTDSLAAS